MVYIWFIFRHEFVIHTQKTKLTSVCYMAQLISSSCKYKNDNKNYYIYIGGMGGEEGNVYVFMCDVEERGPEKSLYPLYQKVNRYNLKLKTTKAV